MNFKNKYHTSRSGSNLNDSNNHLNGHNTNGHSNGYHQNNNGKIVDQNSDGSFTETDSGTTKSRPTSRINCKWLIFNSKTIHHKNLDNNIYCFIKKI